MGLLGARGFLEASIGGVIRRMYKDKVVFDIGAGGPMGGPGVGITAAMEGVDLMTFWLQEIWDSIWSARDGCPEYVLSYTHCLASNSFLDPQRATSAVLPDSNPHRRTLGQFSCACRPQVSDCQRIHLPSVSHPSSTLSRPECSRRRPPSRGGRTQPQVPSPSTAILGQPKHGKFHGSSFSRH
jgi:hypothetical protein